MLKIEHIGIAVKNLEAANRLFAALLNTAHYKVETVESEQVSTSFFAAGESKIELLEATGPESPIAKFIEKRGEGIHHIAFHVDDIHETMKQMKDAGFILLSDEPKKGADQKLVCFLHPKSTNGILVEFCQDMQ